ncbi:unnamed protein product [Penicillium nalgiovense]|nr:unnamed protein product [Penicillium nalgiovense]
MLKTYNRIPCNYNLGNVHGLSNVIAQNNGITSFPNLQTLDSLQLQHSYRLFDAFWTRLYLSFLFLFNIPLSYRPHFHRLSTQLFTLIRFTAFRRALLPMAGAEQKSFLGTLTPWSTPRSATPTPQPSDPPDQKFCSDRKGRTTQ